MKMNKRSKTIQFQRITPEMRRKIDLDHKRIAHRKNHNTQIDNKIIDSIPRDNTEIDNDKIDSAPTGYIQKDEVKVNHNQTSDQPINDKQGNDIQVNNEEIHHEEVKINKKSLNKKRKAVVILGSLLGLLGAIYIGGSLFFTNHFYWETYINGILVGGENLHETQEKLEALSSNYTLELKERNEKTEVLQASDIGLTYSLGDKVQKLKEKEGAWDWPLKSFKVRYLEVKNEISYDKELLKDRVSQLTCFTDEHIRKPEDASVKYMNDQYEVVEGDKGNTVNSVILYQSIVKAIKNQEESIDLDANHCYEGPLYSKDSPRLNALKDELNHYLEAEITYDFGDRQEVIDRSLLSSWLSIDENIQVVLDEEAVTEYVVNLAEKYDTLGKTRAFVATTGSKVSVVGGDYGWKMNVQDEIGQLLNLLKEGRAITREPLYIHTALQQGNSDIGATYVEINLSRQHLWFYKEGKLVVDSDIVTGNLSRNYDTPQGTYTLDYKKANAILRGPGYASPVKYWMPFNGGIGLHDASWRSSFGGEIYRTNGSHGCINLPIPVAGEIFNNIESGVPVVCYFEGNNLS